MNGKRNTTEICLSTRLQFRRGSRIEMAGVTNIRLPIARSPDQHHPPFYEDYVIAARRSAWLVRLLPHTRGLAENDLIGFVGV
jgi:hypothetical protein